MNVFKRDSKGKPLFKKSGFTLIELLVVISIIAILLSIMMPALNKVKKQARVVICSSNLGQIAKGLITYTVSHDGKFMTRGTGGPALMWHPNVANDMRAMLLEYAALESPELLFCPLVAKGNFCARPGIDPAIRNISDEDRKYGQYFYVHMHTSGNLHYYAGYHLFAGLQADPDYYGSVAYSWRFSGNSSTLHAPRSVSGKDCLLADRQEAFPAHGFGSLGKPYRSNHGVPFESFATPLEGTKFTDSNAAYGDGHVEKHSELKYYVERVGLPMLCEY